VKRPIDIVIVGAGLSGLTVAGLLLQSGQDRLQVAIVDAADAPVAPPGDETALRVSAIATGSVGLLDGIGAWERLAEDRVCPYECMRVWDESMPPDGPATLVFDAAEFAVAQLGFIVENLRLQAALLAALADADVQWIHGTPVEALTRTPRGHRVVLGDGRSLHADLVIGADGARSRVRELAGIETRDWPYGQTAFVAHLKPGRPHRHTAWQRFLSTGPLGMLPLADGRISVVWSTTDAGVERALAASDAELSAMLTDASGEVLGRLEASGPRGSFPLCARHAARYVVPGIVLVGDAAHTVHPLAGQGANLGLQDAAALAGVIGDALERGEHPGDRPVLRRYERKRKGANAAMLHFMTALNRLFAADSAPLRVLRTTGMRLFNHSGPLREYMVGVALGGGR
jgi:2-octaprenylphenol hydroxylase